MIVNFIYDPSVNNAPIGFTATLNAVASFFQNTFSDPVTVNINVGYGKVNGQSLGANALGTSLTYLSNYSYSQLTAALATDAKSADDTSSVNSLPISNPTGDFGDWAASAGNGAALAFSNPGVVNAFSQTDIRLMDVLGWNSTPSVPDTTPPTLSSTTPSDNSTNVAVGANLVLIFNESV